MSERVFSLPNGGSYLLTDAAAAALLTLDGDAVRLYVHLLRQGGRYRPEEARAALGLDDRALERALNALGGKGLLGGDRAAARQPGDARPDYTGREVAASRERDPSFRHVVEETQRRLGRVLSNSDLEILFGLYDWRGFPPGVILLLVSYCLDEYARRHGPGGRPPTLRMIDKQAAAWEQEGVNTEERAERYIHDREAARLATTEVYRALGISGRAPAPTEERYVSDWIGMGFSPELITLAYDRTVLQSKGLNWPYMHSILKRWREKGLFTREEVEAGDAKPSRPSAAPSLAAGTQTAPSAARNRQAMERMRRYLDENEPNE